MIQSVHDPCKSNTIYYLTGGVLLEMQSAGVLTDIQFADVSSEIQFSEVLSMI